jgi:hypothetical protein
LNLDFDEYNIWNPVFVPFGYKDVDEIKAMEKEALNRFYKRPKYMLKRILAMRSIEDFRRNLKGFRMLLGFTKNK